MGMTSEWMRETHEPTNFCSCRLGEKPHCHVCADGEQGPPLTSVNISDFFAGFLEDIVKPEMKYNLHILNPNPNLNSWSEGPTLGLRVGLMSRKILPFPYWFLTYTGRYNQIRWWFGFKNLQTIYVVNVMIVWTVCPPYTPAVTWPLLVLLLNVFISVL